MAVAKPAPRKAAAKTAPKPAAAPAAKSAKVEKAPKVEKLEKVDKPRKPKPVLVRDGFTMPEADFSLIATLKARAIAGGREAKKSELLRAGLQALAALEAPALVAALGRLEAVKVGRPKKGH